MSATCPFCAGAGLVDDPGWSHPGRGYRADYPRTPGDGLIEAVALAATAQRGVTYKIDDVGDIRVAVAA